MMRRQDKRWVAGIGIALLCLLCGCTAIVPIDLSGTWAGQISWLTGPATGLSSPLSLNLAHENRIISGTVTLTSSQETFDITIDNGRSTGSTLIIEASGTNNLVTPPAVVLLDLSGGFDSTNMAGTGTQTINGTVYEIEWSATLMSGGTGS